MDDAARHQLCELVGTYGRDLADNPRRTRALLLDVCGDFRKEVNVLTACVEEDVARDLLRTSAGTPIEVLIARLTRRLEEAQGLASDGARWGVESWAIALGVLAPAGASPTPQPELTPTARDWPPPAPSRPSGRPEVQGQAGVGRTETAATEAYRPESSTISEPVGAGRRVAAAIIDGVCIVAVSFGVWLAYDALRHPTVGYVDVARLVNPAVALIWFVTGEAWDGQTLGKVLCGIRVVRTSDAGRPGFLRSLGRHVASQVSGLAFGLGYLWMLWSPRRATWHDSISSTMVIRK